MRKYLLDTNIILYLEKENELVKNAVNNAELFISELTEVEALGFADLAKESELKIRSLFRDMKSVPMSQEIKDIAIYFMKTYRAKPIDSIVAATAYSINAEFMTADAKLFKIQELRIHRIEFQK